ncbi:hypothetical protein AB0B66_23930 [Catellatospora sp. NPDC049111]|uniref:hypothetical protein n=1 Tax=Catellatospora sp. NPDC049111 TaxID=3155271 RepID=UPI0033E1E5CB
MHTADHRAHFVNAVHAASPLAGSYRTKAAVSAELPPAVPAPRFGWTAGLAGHVVPCFVGEPATAEGVRR